MRKYYDGQATEKTGGAIPIAQPVEKPDAKFHAVEYAGYWQIKTKPYYDAGDNILDAEDVGYDKAKENAELIVNLLNKHYEQLR